MNEGIIDVLDRDVDCGNTQMDSHAVNEGEQIGLSALSKVVACAAFDVGKKNKRSTLVQLSSMTSMTNLDLGVTLAAMAKEDRPSQSSDILGCRHANGDKRVLNVLSGL
ncbi:hypothetical protein AAC387_Pa12g0652 [Persea americana]